MLRDPPVTGLALGRSLGCLVAARLAARHGITVRLRAGEGDGVAAYVILPRLLLAEEVGRAEPPDARAGRSARAAIVPRRPADAAPPSASTEAAARAPDFDAGLQAPPRGGGRRPSRARRARWRLTEAPAERRRPAGGRRSPAASPGRRPRPCPSRRSSRRCGATPTRSAPCSPATAPASQAGRARPTGPADEERS